MAKRADSVVGIDLGKHVLKGVALRRKNDSRFILTNFASRPVPEEFASADDLSRDLKGDGIGFDKFGLQVTWSQLRESEGVSPLLSIDRRHNIVPKSASQQ